MRRRARQTSAGLWCGWAPATIRSTSTGRRRWPSRSARCPRLPQPRLRQPRHLPRTRQQPRRRLRLRHPLNPGRPLHPRHRHLDSRPAVTAGRRLRARYRPDRTVKSERTRLITATRYAEAGIRNDSPAAGLGSDSKEFPMDVVTATQFLATLNTPTAVSWLAFIIIGGIAGWVASKIVRGGGSGILLDVVVGVIGGYLGGVLLGWLGVDVEHGHRWFTFFTALLGAIILLFVVRLVRGAARR